MVCCHTFVSLIKLKKQKLWKHQLKQTDAATVLAQTDLVLVEQSVFVQDVIAAVIKFSAMCQCQPTSG